MQQYYIISLKHTSKGDTALLFFGPNNCGYTYHRDRAGKYSHEDALKFSGTDAPMVECEIVDPFWMNAIDFGDKFIAVANTPAVRKAIGITDKLMKPKKYAGCRMAFMNTPVAPLATLLLLFLFFASCGPSKYLECPKYVGIAIDTIPTDSTWDMRMNKVGVVYRQIRHADAFKIIIAQPDTISAMLQVSNNRPMRVCYAIPGYVVQYVDGVVYLDRKKKRLDPRLTVWRYIIDEKRRMKG